MERISLMPHMTIPVFSVQLLIDLLNFSPHQREIGLQSARENVMHQHKQCAAQQRLINAKGLAVHPVRVKTQDGYPNNLQHQAVLETFS